MVSRARGGSTVYLDSSASQKVPKTLGSVPQPKVDRDYETGEVTVDWVIDSFVWWSEFLKKLPRAYTKLLQMFDIPKEDYSADYSGFHRYYHVVKTDCVNSIFVPVVSAGKFHPYTSVKHKRRASCRAYDRLEFLQKECKKRHVKFDYLIALELTLPKNVSERWKSEEVQGKIREAVKDFMRILYSELFPEHHSKFGAVKNDHFWSSKKPLKPHRHIHLTVPNVCYNSKSDMFHRFKPFIKANVVRKCWKKALLNNNLWIDYPDKSPVVYVNYIKFSDRGRVLHRLSYCCRMPKEDLVRKSETLNLSDFDKEFAEFLLNYTPRRINLGFLTNLKKFGYSRKSIPFRCPICGGEMEPELDKCGDKRLYPRPPPEVPDLFRSKEGEWCETFDLRRGEYRG